MHTSSILPYKKNRLCCWWVWWCWPHCWLYICFFKCAGEVANVDFWTAAGVACPSVPSDTVLKDVLRDLFSGPRLPSAFTKSNDDVSEDLAPELKSSVVGDDLMQGLSRCAPANTLAARQVFGFWHGPYVHTSLPMPILLLKTLWWLQTTVSSLSITRRVLKSITNHGAKLFGVPTRLKACQVDAHC